MSEDAGAAAGTAEGAQDTAGTAGQDPGAQQGAGDDGRSPEDMLADAVAGDDSKDDVAKQLAHLQKQNADLKKHQRTWEARAKENASAAQKLAEIEDRDKTELQRTADRAMTAEKRADEAEALYHRTMAAAQHAIPPSLIDQVSGRTEEECAASAEALASAISAAAEERAQVLLKANGTAPAQRQQSRPVESLRPGAAPAGSATGGDPDTWLRTALARQ